MIKKLCVSFILVFNIFSLSAQNSNPKNIQKTLDSVWKTDQEIRFKLIDLQRKGKMNSMEFKDLVQKMNEIDSVNLMKVKAVLKNGWPENLNSQANQTIFLVIQHSDLETQKKFLPVIKQAVKDQKTLPGNLALLQDRIALREGRKQIYGSQVYIDSNTEKKYVQPIQNPKKVDSLRAQVGLPTMEFYLSQAFQMHWSLEDYYNDLPEVEKLLKEKAGQ